MTHSALRSSSVWLLLVAVSFFSLDDEHEAPRKEKALVVQFLEIVSSDVEATCAALSKVHGATFSKPVPEFGNARTASLVGGGMISVRAPMRATENPVVRPYLLVKDIAAAVKAAKDAGAEIAIPAMEIPGRGQFAIYVLEGIEHGLWQN